MYPPSVALKETQILPTHCGTTFYVWSLFFMHHCKEVVFNELTVLHDTSSKASKRPRKENPTKSPKMPPSSATFKFDVRQLQLSPAIWCFTNQRGERVDQLLSFKPGNKYFFVIRVACHITDFLILPKKIKT